MQMKTACFLAFTLSVVPLSMRAQVRPAATPVIGAQSGQAGPTYGSVPLMFEENQGQSSPQVKYLSRGSGYSIFLTGQGLVVAVRPSGNASARTSGRGSSLMAVRKQQRALTQAAPSSLSINLVGAAANPVVVGEHALPTKVNYFIGRNPSQWRRNIPTYGQIRYRNVYPGIDLVYYGNSHKLEYDFDLAAGADVRKIGFAINGADSISVDASGNLVIAKGGSTFILQTPAIYQEVNGSRTPVAGKYTLNDPSHVGFSVGNYDNTKPLVIDPVLVYSTFLGGSADDFSNGIAVDSSGDAYVTGITDSPDFPLATIGSYSSTQFRMYLTKFDPSGSTLLFADYFGGTSGGDQAYAVALDSSGNAYVTGCTTSSDFPVMNAYQSSLAGSQDAFLTEFSSDGSSLTYSTYLGGASLTSIGGSTSQFGNSVSVDATGEAVVAGVTTATDFPTVSANQSSVSADQFGDWGEYGFVTKFAAGGASLVYSTYLGGNTVNVPSCAGCTFPDSEALGVAIDSSGNAYVTGTTNTTNFPVTSGAFTQSYPGYYQSNVGFVAKFTSSGGAAYSTYLGGSTSSFLNAIAVDSNGSAYVTGYDSAGDDFPIVSTSICDPSVSSCNGAIIAKLDPTGATLSYSTFLGTSNNMAGQSIQVDASGDAFIVGSDVGFDLASPIENYAGNGDVVVAEVDPTASNLLFATFLGGQGSEEASGLALDSTGAVYVTGVTQSVDFPVMQGDLQTGLAGGNDVFVSKIDPVTNAPAVAFGPSSLQFASQVIGTSSAGQTDLLRNMGSQALTIVSKTTTGDFSEADDCGASVPAASYCTFTITFTPTASGDRAGTLTISDDASGSPHSIALSGTGTAGDGDVSVSPSSVSFSPSPVGATSGAQAVTVTNASGNTVALNAIHVTSNFAIAGNNCQTIPAYGSCALQVNFTPLSGGTSTGSLQFTDSLANTVHTIALSGSGTDFVTSSPNTSASVAPGGTAYYDLSISPTGGAFSNTISFNCVGAPAFSTCAVSPTSIRPGSKPSSVTVAITTAGQAAQTQPPISWHGGPILPIAYLSFAAFGVMVCLGSMRRKLRSPLAMTMVAMALLVLAGCGANGSQNGQSPNPSNATPPGKYNVAVVASSGRLQHSTNLTLIVQ